MLEHLDKLKQKLEFAANVMKRLPYSSVSGYKNFWPQIKHSQAEIADWEPVPKHMRPSAEEISLMDEILEWYKPLSPEETKLVWMRACRVPWKIIMREINYHRSTLSEKYNCALGKMLGYIYRRPRKFN